MAGYNRVIIMGNLTRDPELKYTPAGTAVCNFSIAIGSKYKTKDGATKDEVVFVNNITAWMRLAEICGEYLHKGSPVLIEGRLWLNSWEDKESGKKMNQLRVTAEKIQMLGRKSDTQQTDAPTGGSPSEKPDTKENVPAGGAPPGAGEENIPF